MKFLNLLKENITHLIIILVIFFFDRFSKIKILQILENSDIIFINDYLNLDLIFNTGIGFGLLSMEANVFYDLISVFIATVCFVAGSVLFPKRQLLT